VGPECVTTSGANSLDETQVKAFSYRRVKNQRDAADLADVLRMGRLPHAWMAPPQTRELRELVDRHGH
jgi:hypothetical protein